MGHTSRVQPPPTRFATAPDGVHLAYQVVGEGPVDLLYMWNTWSNVDVMWEWPSQRHWLMRLSSFARLIVMDKRGTGVSDRACPLGTFETQIDDVEAVLEAAASSSVVLVGGGDAGLLALVYAASHPDHVSGLVLLNSCARRCRGEDYPYGRSVEEAMTWTRSLLPAWGTGVTPRVGIPSENNDQARAWYGKLERNSISPGSLVELNEMVAASDARPALPLIRMPCLVMHRTEDPYMPVAMGRYLAEHLPTARYVEQPGNDHAGFAGDADAMLDEVEAFVTGSRPAPRADRVLATVLFTDIVGSTSVAAAKGDAEWRRLLQQHNAIAEREVNLHRGTLVATTGDGIMASFDGPGRAIACARAIRSATAALELSVRAGLHTGEIELVDGGVAGIAVHLAARVMAEASAGDIFVSGAIPPLVVGSGLTFLDLGERDLKGLPDKWRLFAVADE